MEAGRPPRLLLVEFSALDRFHRATTFPFLKGWCRGLGVPVSWLRFGVRASRQFERRETGVGLAAGDLRTLLRVLDEARPTHVLFDRAPARALGRALLDSRPGTALACVERLAADGPGPDVEDPRRFADWLGLPPDPERRAIPDWRSAVPDYGWAAGNSAALRAEPLPYIIGGRECVYERPIAGVPCFKGVRLGRIRGGCSFCARPRGERSRPAADILDMARRQLRAIQETHPPFPKRPILRVAGHELFLAADRIIRAAKGLGLPPSDFLFDARADVLLRSEGRLLRALRECRGSGHRVHLALVGIENFSAAELERMNKGCTPAQNVAAVRLLLELEAGWPETFCFREHGGLSMIVFTPWTKLKDVLLNAAVVRVLGLDRLCGKFLTARLRLYPDLPLARLAERDGLLVARYADPLLDTARRNLYAAELPWRFRHPEVETVNRIFTRLVRDRALAGDALYRRVQSWRRSLAGRGREPLAAAQAVARAAEGLAGAVLPVRILARAKRALHPAPGPGAASFPGNAEVLWAVRHGPPRGTAAPAPKRVRRIESVDADHLALCRRHPLLFPNLATHQGARCPAGGCDLFIGRDPADVREAVRLTAREERLRADAGAPEHRRIAARLGILLGYPVCCSRAFASGAVPTAGSNGWRWVALRSGHPGRIPLLMHPGYLGHVPCSLTCRPSLAMARRCFDAEAGRFGRARADAALRESASRPLLMLLDAASGDPRLPLIPREGPSERFRYRAAPEGVVDPRFRPVCEGDELVVEPGCVTVLLRGREHAYFPMDAFLWWRERAFHADFWRAAAALRDRARLAESVAVRPAVRRAPVDPESVRLRRALSPCLSAPRLFAGYRVGSLGCEAQPMLAVTLERGDDRFELFIGRSASVVRPFAVAGAYAVTYGSDTPLDAPGRVAAVEQFVQHLARSPGSGGPSASGRGSVPLGPPRESGAG